MTANATGRALKIICVVGARPNFMKMAPILNAMAARPGRFAPLLVHTGQHYDEKMSQTFFTELGLPRPDLDLGVGSGSHAVQTAKVMVAFEEVCLQHQPDRILVVGDVNSTLAATLVGAKLGIPVAHVEAGLRSRDMSMPEEVNRLCTDVLCDQLYTTDALADENLRAEGIPAERIHRVGNVMIDSLRRHQAAAANRPVLQQFGLQPGGYALLTLHRPATVDDRELLEPLLRRVHGLAQQLPVIFPIHPRTRGRIEAFGLGDLLNEDLPARGLFVTEPLGYLDFLALTMHARLVATDSGGLQEETTVLGVPCLTLRDNTERPITCTEGTNRLIGRDPDRFEQAFLAALQSDHQQARIPELWDGHAAGRIVDVLLHTPVT